MTQVLSDGTVIPSYLATESRGSWRDPGTQTNIGLRIGEVREIIDPTDVRSVSGRFLEYNVEIQHQDRNNPGTAVMYQNCVLLNMFGSVADILRYTLRPDTKTPEDGVGVGAKVLLLCVNGTQTKAVILGGVRDTGPAGPSTGYQGSDVKADGHNLFFEFNGCQLKVNDAGEVKVTFRGKTNTDGTLDANAVAAAEGTNLFFDKNGGVKIATPSDAQFIYVDHQNKKIDILADTQWHVKVNGKLSFEVGDQVTITGNKGIDIGATSQITMKSSGVIVGGASDNWPLFTTYRNAQSTMSTSQITALGTLSGLMATAGSALTTAAGMMIIPIAGAMAAAAPISAAAQALIAAGPIFDAIASSITSFEAGSASYQSNKNKND